MQVLRWHQHPRNLLRVAQQRRPYAECDELFFTFQIKYLGDVTRVD
jgi:hypothetical protein